MSRKLYEQKPQGGIKFTSRRMGEVRVPNFVYDIWLPILGARGVAVYSVYCRLEREKVVKAITQADIAKACRIGPGTLATVNEQLEECGFIKITKPEGHKRLMHWTTEIAVHDPPTEVSAEIMQKYEHPQGYEALSTWLVAPEIPDSISEDTNQSLDEIPDSISKVVSLGLHPLEVHGADAPTPFPEEPEEAPATEPRGEALITEFFGEKPEREPVQETLHWTEQVTADWANWGYGSEEFERQVRQYGENGYRVKRLGYEFERLTGLHPVWSDKREIERWCTGLWKCLQAANYDAEIVLQAARELLAAEMTVTSPWSVRGKARAIAGLRRVPKQSGLNTPSQVPSI